MKYTYNDVKSYIESQGYTLLSEMYINSEHKIKIANNYNQEFEVTFRNFKKGYRPENRVHKYTFEEVKVYVEKHGYNMLSNKYINANTPIRISPKDNPHKIYNIRFSRFKQNIEKPKSVRQHQISLTEINKSLIANHYAPLTNREYKNTSTPVHLICQNGHNWKTTIQIFRQGGRCPQCNNKYSVGEMIIFNLLTYNNISFNYQHRVKINNHNHYFDFYLPDLKIVIEYDGIQHYKPISFWGGEKGFIKQQEKDQTKTKYCLNHNLKIIRIPYQYKSSPKIFNYLQTNGLPDLKYLSDLNYRLENTTTSKQTIIRYYLSHPLKDTAKKFNIDRKTVTSYFKEIYNQSKTEYLKAHY